MRSVSGITKVSFLAVGLSLALYGCGGGGGGSTNVVNGVKYTVSTAADIAQTSADSYDDNINGVISGGTLKTWIDDWAANRPAGITGKLIIFQVSKGPAGSEYISHDESNVFTYYTNASSEWTQVRSNGVVETVSMVPDGATMDALLKKYNIDPSKDMIVVAMGTGSTGNAMGQGRIWYALRYWGVSKEHLAILNGGNQWLDDAQMFGRFMADDSVTYEAKKTASLTPSYPNNGTASVKDLHVDNTILQATLGDVMRIVPAVDQNVLNDGIFLWDARSLGNYEGSAFQNNGSRQGHPNGALLLEYSNLLDSAKGYAYKDKAVLQTYLNGDPGNAVSFIDGAKNAVGMGNAYQTGDVVYTYCETTFRAMITGVASGVILGLPTRFYDGAMTEWNSLSNMLDKNGNYLLPANSPWRTDFSAKSFFVTAASLSKSVDPRTFTNPYASNTQKVIIDDKTYKTGETVTTTSSGSSGVAGGNACS